MWWSWEARVSRLSCCVTSDRPVLRGAPCPSDLGTGLRGHCGFCRPEPQGHNRGLALPASWSQQEQPCFCSSRSSGTPSHTSQEQDGGWSWGRIAASARPLSARDCSGPWFSLCAMGQQPELCPLPPASLWSPSLPRGWADKEGFAKTKSPSVWRFWEGLRVLRNWRPGGVLSCWSHLGQETARALAVIRVKTDQPGCVLGLGSRGQSPRDH